MWGVAFLVSLKPQGIPRLDAVSVDATVILFTFGIAVVTGLVFGMVPALHATRGALSGSLKEGGRGAVTSRGGARVRGILVVAEMALAVMLLAGAGLLMRSFMRLQSVDPGIQRRRRRSRSSCRCRIRATRKNRQQVAFFDQLLPRLRALPGVRAADAVMMLPLTGNNFNISFAIAGRPPVPPALQPSMEVRVTTPGYFSEMGIPLKRGRGFTDDDKAGTPRGGAADRGLGAEVLPERGSDRQDDHARVGPRPRQAQGRRRSGRDRRGRQGRRPQRAEPAADLPALPAVAGPVDERRR